MNGLDPEMTKVVHTELGEALDQLLEFGERLGAQGMTDAEYVRAAFRIFHNVKGALRLGGFEEAEQLAHRVEDRLDTLRAATGAVTGELVAALEQALAACLTAVGAGGSHPDVATSYASVERLDEKAAPETVVHEQQTEDGAPSLLGGERSAAGESSTLGPAGRSGAIRIEADRLDRLMELGSEYLAQHGRMRRKSLLLREFSDRLALVLRRDRKAREALGSLAGDFEAFVRSDELDLRRTGQLTADFDRAMREVRMQPLGGIVPQLRRVVSEAARELGKKAHLSVDFGEVELDRHVLETLREPLMHLLRNAVDHGLESEAERRLQGKSERGEVRVSARIDGANVAIEVSDDGRGIDVGKVRARAIALGSIGADDVFDDAELVDTVLFSPGFSTAAQVTSLSGRGVGLDVVRSRVAELGGIVRVNLLGRAGVTFTLSVPASVVSLRGLSVRASGVTYVLPSTHVERTLRIAASELASAEGVTIVRTFEGDPLRLRWLSSTMGAKRSFDPAILQVVVLADGANRLGLVVDEVQGDTTFVIKRLPWNVRRVPGVVGAAHQGDAALALVVDMSHLLRGTSLSGDDGGLALALKQDKRRILVADDSLTSRTLERNILVGAGYEVHVVEDGQAALEALTAADFDLVVSDVQMPVMDGLELTRRVRAHPVLARLPVILVTSLDRPEDVAEGARVGADEYIVKGQFDQEALLRAVSRLL